MSCQEQISTIKKLLDSNYYIEGVTCGLFKNVKNGFYIVSKEKDNGEIVEYEFCSNELLKAVKLFDKMYENERLTNTDEGVDEENELRLIARGD